MNRKKFFAIITAIAMVGAMLPCVGMAASDTKTLFTLSDIASTFAGQEVDLDQATHGISADGGYVKLNGKNWLADGTWADGDHVAALSFFKTTSQGSGTNTDSKAVFANKADTAGANRIIVDFKLATMTDKANNYGTLYLNDIDGNPYARIFADFGTATTGENQNSEMNAGVNTTTAIVARGSASRADVLANVGQKFRIKAEKYNDSYKVTYLRLNGDVYTTLATETIDSVNGIGSIQFVYGGWSDQWAGLGLIDLEVSYDLPASLVSVNATYKVGENTVATEKLSYDSSVSDGATFPAKTYSPDGSTTLYAAPEKTLSADEEIQMTLAANPDVSGFKKDGSFSQNGKKYIVKSDNLVPNGDFSNGVAGWYNGQNTAAVVTLNGDNTVTMNDGGGGSANALYRSWAIESGKTYVLTYTASVANQYHVVSLANNLGASTDNENATNGGLQLLGGNCGTNDVAGQNNVIFTNTDGYAYVRSSFRWAGGNKVGNFGLYEIEEDTSVPTVDVTVNYTYGGETVATKTLTGVAAGTNYEEKAAASVSDLKNAGSALMYKVAADVSYPIEATTTEINIPVVLHNVYTVRSDDVHANNITDDGNYKAWNNFGAMSWDTKDRIGVAVLDVTKAAQYDLVGTQVRAHTDGKATPTIDFYAVSLSNFKAISKYSDILSFITEENLVATKDYTGCGNNQTAQDFSVKLDKAKIDAAAGDSGKVVIIGNATDLLFGLAGDTMKIASSNGSVSVDTAARYSYDSKSYELVFEAEATTDATIKSYGFDYDAAALKGGAYAELTTLSHNTQADGDKAIFRLVIKGIKDADTIRLYGAKPYIILENDVKVEGTVAKTSLFKEVATQVAEYEGESIAQEKVDAINAMLVVFVDTSVNPTNAKHPEYAEAAALIMDFKSSGEIHIKDKAADFGIGFTRDTKFYIGGILFDVSVDWNEADDAKVFRAASIEYPDVKLVGAIVTAAEAELFVMDAVELDFVPETVDEAVEEDVQIGYEAEELI